jgi:hypothetical protein
LLAEMNEQNDALLIVAEICDEETT